MWAKPCFHCIPSTNIKGSAVSIFEGAYGVQQSRIFASYGGVCARFNPARLRPSIMGVI